MARKRVQVDKLRPSAKLQAVARPVETYVRPAQVQPAESELGAFVRAVAPAVKTLADLQKQEALKKNREIERGNASRRAFDAKIGSGRALREAHLDYVNNQEEYMNLSTEEIAERRQGIMQSYFDQVAESGDDILIEAFNQDIQLGNLNFFTQSYDPEKLKYDTNNQLDEVFTEILAIEDNPDNAKPAFTDPYAEKDKPIPTIANQQINDLLSDFQKVSGIPWSVINEYALATVTNRADTNGRGALYKWLEDNKVLGVARFQDTVRTLNARLRTYDGRVVDANKDSVFASTVYAEVESYVNNTRDGIPSAQTFSSEVTFADGSTRSISDEERILAFEQYAQVNQLSQEEQVELFYRPLGIVPTVVSNNIISGKSILQAGDLTPENLSLAMQAYKGFIFLRDNEIQAKSTLISADDRKLFNAVAYLMDKSGVGGEGADENQRLAEALRQVQNIDLKMPRKTVSMDDVASNIDAGMFDFTDLDEVTNTGVLAKYITEGTNIYMQLGNVTMEDAMAAAIKDTKKDFIIIEASNGTKQAISLYDTNIARQGNEMVQFQRYLNEYVQSETAMQRMAKTSGATGYTIRSTDNKNVVGIALIDDSGNVVGNLMEVPVSVVSNPETVADMLRIRMNQKAEDERYFTGELGVLPPVETFDTEETVAAGEPTLESMDMPIVPIVQTLPEAMDVKNGREILEDGEFTGMYLYTGTLPDGSTVTYKSPQRLDKVITDESATADEGFTENDEVYVDTIMKLAEELGTDVSEVNTTVTALEQELNTDFSRAFDEVNAYSQNEIDELKERALRSKAIKDMEGTDEEKESILETIFNFFSPSAAEASEMSDADVSDVQGTGTTAKATNLIMKQEDFRSAPYKDGAAKSVGYGFYIPALEADEKALIKNVNNVTKPEADRVIALKISKIENFWGNQVPNFSTFSEEAQAALISMAYQLGRENVPQKFPTFMENLQLAAQAPEGSQERKQYLRVAANNMIYNYKNGKQVGKTLWHTQTPKRARAMAALVAEG